MAWLFFWLFNWAEIYLQFFTHVKTWILLFGLYWAAMAVIFFKLYLFGSKTLTRLSFRLPIWNYPLKLSHSDKKLLLRTSILIQVFVLIHIFFNHFWWTFWHWNRRFIQRYTYLKTSLDNSLLNLRQKLGGWLKMNGSTKNA